mmetsp:Transcript_43478/g.64504  ORF Transcript_43478/g.64504 Transcript_43478/m.64504 type:complete len:201 (+) Transcript_43478:992-1594(+)
MATRTARFQQNTENFSPTRRAMENGLLSLATLLLAPTTQHRPISMRPSEFKDLEQVSTWKLTTLSFVFLPKRPFPTDLMFVATLLLEMVMRNCWDALRFQCLERIPIPTSMWTRRRPREQRTIISYQQHGIMPRTQTMVPTARVLAWPLISPWDARRRGPRIASKQNCEPFRMNNIQTLRGSKSGSRSTEMPLLLTRTQP